VGPGDLRREFDYAAAVYGSVLVTALVGAAFEDLPNGRVIR
jgi:hypothetical protein